MDRTAMEAPVPYFMWSSIADGIREATEVLDAFQACNVAADDTVQVLWPGTRDAWAVARSGHRPPAVHAGMNGRRPRAPWRKARYLARRRPR